MVVYNIKKKKGSATDPWGTPVASWCGLSILSEKRPACEVGLIQGKSRYCDAQIREDGQEDDLQF